MIINRDEALVEIYRDVLKIKENVASQLNTVPSLVPGTGRNCKPGRCVPSKRIKAAHRSADTGASLRKYARCLAEGSGPLSATATRWLTTSKGVRP